MHLLHSALQKFAQDEMVGIWKRPKTPQEMDKRR